jgi:hypothetical protein
MSSNLTKLLLLRKFDQDERHGLTLATLQKAKSYNILV